MDVMEIEMKMKELPEDLRREVFRLYGVSAE